MINIWISSKCTDKKVILFTDNYVVFSKILSTLKKNEFFFCHFKNLEKKKKDKKISLTLYN